ncbi:50S ribosomal protein L10 [Candidatus Woesearchaeota archaeon]|nr:MAG: 50S ribosomal protein L10 [Candidatus Woesearchaeota archaeon]
MSKPKAFVSEAKKKEVQKLKQLMKSYPIIGIVDMENLPAPQLLKMKNQLAGKAVVRMSKGRLIKVAIDELKSEINGIEKLKEYIRGMPALILTKENPFKLFKTLQKSKSSAPAKPGQVAPFDIVVQAGPTSFAPGPIIGELGSMGIKTAIEDGKVAIKADKVLVQEGETINEKQAALLSRLGIEPMEVGLNLIAVLEDGTVFTRKILAVDEKEYVDNIKAMSAEAFNLAMFIAYPCEDTIKMLIAKASREANGLADSQDILTEENVGRILAKAERQGQTLKAKAKIE